MDRTAAPLTPPSGPPAVGLTPDAAYQVLQTHDARFDGRLFVGVTSTGVYCRPVCRVRLPRRENCRFFGNAASAECAGFRPCLRCRPELAPGLATTDSSQTLARAGARLIEHAVAQGHDLALPQVAARLGVTDRHFRRVFQAVHGVSPMDWLATQRLLLAKRLLTDTQLPVTRVALASGFASLRRFNAAFAERYRLSPTALRRSTDAAHSEPVAVRLAWRPPYDAEAMLDFLAARPLTGIEAVTDGQWRRTLALTDARGERYQGWMAVRFDTAACEVCATVSPSLAPVLGAVIERLRHLLDLDAEAATIDSALATMPVALRPGLRLPGCVDGFETTVRVILGQQVTVAAACTLAARLVARFGEPVATTWPGLTHLFPRPEVLAAASADSIGELGIVSGRIRAIQALSREVAESRIDLSPAAPMEETLAALAALPGIGAWTTEMVALRVLAWPDAFPASDIGVMRALGADSPAAAGAQAEAWRPWRSYAVMQLWRSIAAAALPTPARPPRASRPSPSSRAPKRAAQETT
ncbi:AlkA N-terminal domain-containing protein [Ideonella sp. DXS29W]|uniref:DNA-3-methyladenine glycosylase II n=1 Tax=Ideonella lacteola TaxID=2984193 RepID=A0ABU9BW82_9BURK